MTSTRIGVTGAAGRMGMMVVREIAGRSDCLLCGASARGGSPALKRDVGSMAGLGPLGVSITEHADEFFAAVDVVVDFTTPTAALTHAALARRHRTALVIGTTGFDAIQAGELEAIARDIAVVWTPNMSLGITLLAVLVESASRSLGPDYDIEILEMHHRHKIDAPSGTALDLGRAAAKGRGVHLDQVAATGAARERHRGVRRSGDIGFAVMRGGDVIGDHKVIFAGMAEQIEFVHRANNRLIYAQGAVKAALWVASRAPGLYNMTDVLGLKSS